MLLDGIKNLMDQKSKTGVEEIEMNIVYASDDNYADILGTSMLSLLENNKESESIDVYILDDGIKADNKKKLLSIAEKYNRKLIFVSIPNLHALAGVEIHTNERWSLSTFSRLFLEGLLPQEVEQVIYLDCDILVNSSLEEMYNTDLGDYYCGGVADCLSDGHKSNIGLSSDDYYINAGVMLISLKNWRKAKLCEKFISFLNKYGGNTPYVDQGVINGIIGKNIMPLSLKYDVYTAIFDFSYNDLIKYRKPSKYYSEKEVYDAKENPVIIHFTTSFLSLRPWIENCNHPYVSEWLRYKAMSPWADAPLRKDKRSKMKKLAIGIYKLLPNSVAVCLAGFLHANIVPMIRGWKRK